MKILGVGYCETQWISRVRPYSSLSPYNEETQFVPTTNKITSITELVGFTPSLGYLSEQSPLSRVQVSL